MKFKQYTHEDFQSVCNFLTALNQQNKTHINWNWARWEWMYQHPYCDRTQLHTIGLWKDGCVVVGAAIYDLYHGEAFCAALDGYDELLPEILDYALCSLHDENGLGIAVNDTDTRMQKLMTDRGYQKAEQTETLLCRSLEQNTSIEMPNGFTIREISFPEDNLAYQTVIWKGFDHEGDQAELEKMLGNKVLPPNRRSELCLAVVDSTGEFAAHCTCWYDDRTDYAYVEPVCTIPKYRGMGLGKAVVLEALNRCRIMGAKEAFVISDQQFYKKLGFEAYSHYTFYWKAEKREKMKIEKCTKETFIVIGKEGSTEDGPDFVQRLWADANAHFAEVAHLARKDANGNLLGIWGAMSDYSRSFRPWEDGFSKGLYLAGVECSDDAQPPEGWMKWSVPGFDYLRVVCDHNGVFSEMITYLQAHNMTLAGAVHDFTCPQTGTNYMYFPIRRI